MLATGSSRSTLDSLCKTVPGGIQFHRINGLLMEIIAPTVGYFGMETADHLGQ